MSKCLRFDLWSALVEMQVTFFIFMSWKSDLALAFFETICRENIESKRLSTTVVLSYAQTCCPVLLEPKFLRYHNLLEDHFGYRQGDEPGAAYLEQWQELKRNIRHFNRFQKRAKLRELNKLFEANKGKFESYPTVRYTKLVSKLGSSTGCKLFMILTEDFISNF